MRGHRATALRVRNRMLVGLLGTAIIPALAELALPASSPVVDLFVSRFLEPVALVAAVGCIGGWLIATVSEALSPVAHSATTEEAGTGDEEPATGSASGRTSDVTPDPIERAQRRYVGGEIGELGLESELEDALIETEELGD